MNDISDNPYVKSRKHSLREYTVLDFLYREIAVERVTSVDKIMLVINNILAIHKFNIHYLGFKFLTSLTARYIVKHDYDQASAIAAIANNYGTSTDYVRDCILASIKSNPDFTIVASKSLKQSLARCDDITINDAVEIIGAIFKIFYNYKSDDESFEFDSNYVVNFNRL